MAILLTIGIIFTCTAIYQSISNLNDLLLDNTRHKRDYPRIALYALIAICGFMLLIKVSTNFLHCLTIN